MRKPKIRYKRKIKINYKRFLTSISIFVILTILLTRLLIREDYIDVLKKSLESDKINFSGTISSVSKIDTKVYTNDGLRYTNQHKDIKRIQVIKQDSDKAQVLERLLHKLVSSNSSSKVSALPKIEDGYLWIETNIDSVDKVLFKDKKETYNFDIYYNINSNKIYTLEKYYNEYSVKNNKLKMQSYDSSDEIKELINILVSK